MKAFPILRTIGTVLHEEAKLIERTVNKTPENSICEDIVAEPSWHEMEEHILLRDMEDIGDAAILKTEDSTHEEK